MGGPRSGQVVDVVFLDFSKASDKVLHQRLLLKVASLGIGGKLFDWIRNWLLNRTQRVCINGIVSIWKLVLSGIAYHKGRSWDHYCF